MILQIFAIYDSKAKAFLPPFFMPSEPVAIRLFSECANDSSHAFSKSPLDYSLNRIGEFDDQTASITMLAQPDPLGLASNFKG